tara:strand:- start:170 stop:445 length:276 start_codon:yes stop_codon:yes gene_type:complete
VKTYQELEQENEYLKDYLSFDDYMYVVCVCVDGLSVRQLGCIKFLNGIDYWNSRDKMFRNIKGEKYWVLVEKNVYENFRNGDDSFLVRSSL